MTIIKLTEINEEGNFFSIFLNSKKIICFQQQVRLVKKRSVLITKIFLEGIEVNVTQTPEEILKLINEAKNEFYK